MPKILIFICLLLLPSSLWAIPDILPVPNTVTMIDIGSVECIPCKMMKPILDKLTPEYKGKAEIVFIDIWLDEYKSKKEEYGVKAIPTQIFYDKTGKERYRHQGFLDEKSIRARLDALLAE